MYEATLFPVLTFWHNRQQFDMQGNKHRDLSDVNKPEAGNCPAIIAISRFAVSPKQDQFHPHKRCFTVVFPFSR